MKLHGNAALSLKKRMLLVTRVVTAASPTPTATGAASQAANTCMSPSTTRRASPTSKLLADERATSAVAFLGRAVRFFRRHGVKVERVLTDNGSAYRATIHALACRILAIKHLRTRPRRPQTNGKAERFIRTMLGGRAYGAIYRSSAERTAALDGSLWRHNHDRPHGSPGHKPPAARPAEPNNPLGSYS
jgi:transposase InsO family protein